MALTIPNDIRENGIDQASLVRYLSNVLDLVNELKTDYTALRADVTAIRTSFLSLTAQMDADATLAATNFGSNNNPAAITSTSIAASAVSLNKG